ncbi:glycine betaine ABC transporter substrate-binding protein [Paenalcaligenes suwonensis]|uniref:glycine betaine ABC transporter substrate-binding protein n=1 Tax=Paenalcaligenes suwonensis TaxID=1202713 RepID=UPI00140968EA|nr:glycine betaine ABC transporter substrate-binding protein [Paenalcaligenes suwonensis]NHC62126.1 glycine betaine ABC transporter substrate-binding protein [Paenalcaligenes suwonensis]
MLINKILKRLSVAMGTAVFGLGLLGTGSAYAQDKGTVHLAYVEWSSEVASTNVMRVLLEQAGYDVKMSSLTGAAMWQAVANGDADAMLAAWLPTTHEDYFAQLGDKVEDLGPNLDGTKLGLVVPAYTEINSIEELNDNAKKFNNEIIGIDPGAGLQRLTGDVVDQYNLKLRLRDGTDATMTAALANAIQNNEDVVITAWTPHWMFARWDLKYLEDPKGIYGGAEQIHTIARKGLKDEKPEAYAILDAFNWTTDDMGEIMLMNEEAGSDPYENAKKWVEANPEKVQAWMPTTE